MTDQTLKDEPVEPSSHKEQIPQTPPPPARSNPIRPPSVRRLRGYAFDPSISLRMDTLGINEIVYPVPWEDQLKPGPVGEYVEVVDFDPASQCFYEPVDLNNRYLVAQDGIPPSQGIPQFHQQMAYAVAMTTIRNFEQALGRKVLWRSHSIPDGKGHWKETFVRRLRIYPHALREANAFYDPSKKALLFGYFTASSDSPGAHLPGGTVFTCLSHDIVAHETTHAILDGIHRRFIEDTHPDALAFHEAFSDIVALFQHFSFPEVLRHQIARTRGDLASHNLLGQLAQEFGVAIGGYETLRDALGGVNPETGQWEPQKPNPDDYQTVTEPHARGSILVGAVFDAYTAIYKIRVADLLRIATGGTGVLPSGALHPDLVNRLAAEASKAAQQVLMMCLRALDYCPSANLTYGDYLRAMITADMDLVPYDDRGYRVAFIEAFQRRGIYPAGVRNLSIESLVWPAAEEKDNQDFQKLAEKLGYTPDRKLLFGERHAMFDELARYRAMLHELIRTSLGDLPTFERLTGLSLQSGARVPDLELSHDGKYLFEVHSLYPAQRVGPDGNLLNQFILCITQTRRVPLDPNDPGGPKMPFRGGCTLILDLDTRRLRYRIVQPIDDETRLNAQLQYVSNRSSGSLRAVYFGQAGNSQPFARLHREG
jgi:hypothetical protein